ncbi:hotdog family protein [Legionella septentrionalis]|uniref:Hydroxymyristoyl-ACP dehydratase n=1 Tax=Legionella septentrionalis TaxID=2498109 RepID=A0A3S0VMY7_9GAMM|nr:hydroxymyristoyl-ACP dehydratase [Legionella septentrionalis]RUQ85287.1 hydroxymyristoyl-ACP dehydratase [Legionella septentrionalis]
MRFLFVDRILQLSPAEYVCGIKHVTFDDHYLCQDGEGKWCFIPSLIGETLGQLAAWNVMLHNDFTARPVAGVVASAHLHRPVYVGETLLLESFIDALDDAAVRYHSVARVGDEIVFRIENALGPLLPMEDFIAPECVRRQFAEINRPGHWPLVSPAGIEILPAAPAQISCANMSFDRIVSSTPGEQLCAEKFINRAASYFPDHFPNKPVLPMTVLLECKLNLAREFLARAQFTQGYQVREMRKIKMNDFVQPGDVIACQLSVKQRDEEELILAFRSEVAGKRVCVLEMVLTAEV